jgi:hypothetical protein
MLDADAGQAQQIDARMVHGRGTLHPAPAPPAGVSLALPAPRTTPGMKATIWTASKIPQGDSAIPDEVLRDRDKISKSVREIVDQITDPWGLKVELVEMKDVEIPQTMQRAMAKEAEAAREKRSRIIKAETEQEASKKLADAAQHIAENPSALELRRMQMISEVGVEQNSTTIINVSSLAWFMMNDKHDKV